MTTSVRPVVSVVVATRNRRDRLSQLFAALAAQDGVGPIEAIVVDDASTDGTPQELHLLAARSPFPVSLLRLDRHRGPAAARNAGWRAAAAPLVAFTDDDCTPQPGWLAALVARLDRDADVVQGRTLPDPDADRFGRPFHHTMVVETEQSSYPTCNMGYRRSVLERLRGFDERFAAPAGRRDRHPVYGEDTDLAWRAIESGAAIAFEPAAVVHHEVAPSAFGERLRRARRMQGTVLTVRRHPGLRATLPSHWFYKRSHPPALAALAGLVAAASHPRSAAWLAAGAALAVPYLHHRTRVDGPWCRRREWPLYIPLFLVGDLADIGVLAIASVRYRTLLL